MRWYFRDISQDPSEKELTQQDQFNNDEVALAEALVRETIQNSTDARPRDSSGPVRVRFAISASGPVPDVLRGIVDGLAPHLEACRLDVPPRQVAAQHLVIEDFGTTGLEGATDVKDNGQFSGFWRRFGRSNKEGTKGGRWGLGKLVFPSSSAVRSVIGLTCRPGEDRAWLMGQAILKNHVIDATERDSVGFWCRAGARPGLPTDDAVLCRAVGEAAGFTRRAEPGLSLLVPHLLPDITPDLLVEAVVRNYYFPILTGRVCVTVNDTVIDADTFDRVAAGRRAVPKSLLDFVRLLQAQRRVAPALVLPPEWQEGKVSAALLGDAAVAGLRERLKQGELVAIRAPLRATHREDGPRESHVDVYLKAAVPGEIVQTLVIRGSITVPGEGRRAAFSDCHAALVADHETVSRLLGDAENPSHTQWNERAEKLRTGWRSGHRVLRRIRALLPEVYGLVNERIERDDPEALVEFFSVPRRVAAGRAATGDRPRLSIDATPQPKPFRIERRAGGFAVLPGPGAGAAAFPIRLRVRCAYDVLNGNPFRRYSEYDFNFFLNPHFRIETAQLHHWPVEPNAFDLEARAPDFRFEVSGFDGNRDLIVEAEDAAVPGQA